jgi:KipI family sensor histidine kinase inhibitor
MRLRAVGDAGWLIECRDGYEVEAWRADLWRRREAGEFAADEIVPGARTVLIDGLRTKGFDDLVRGWPEPELAAEEVARGVVEIPVTFDGEDLADVAGHWGITVEAVVARLVATPLSVAFCGFSPGFAYLRGLPAEWAVPRLAAPRPRVPAGAVALADAYAGIYPTASPGGWRLVGRTEVALFDVRATPPARLSPGTDVRLVRR